MRRVLLSAAFLLWAMPAFASSLTITLNNIVLSDGGTWAGSVNFVDGVVDWSIHATGGNESVFPDFTYTQANSVLHETVLGILGTFEPSGPDIISVLGPSSRIIVLFFDHLYRGATSANFLDNATAECYNCNPFRVPVSGNLLIDDPDNLLQVPRLPGQVPEPSSLALAFFGFSALVLGKQRFA